MNTHRPQILAPAGDTASFLAALAAGADAVYVGLKHFSARMAADNFRVSELAAMRDLAERKNARLYVAMNTLVKPDDPEAAGRLVDRLNRAVKPHAIIIQDPGLVALARQAGYGGEIHISTLANVSQPSSLALMRETFGVDRVILPRELTVDEIRTMNDACPNDLELEVFVHGALCYAISGRCYWSSYLGGKSGLRGRCVQPCRRQYNTRGRRERFFSCNDLQLDVLVKPLLEMPKIACWKIEGRKKGPHYVYYVTSAYRLLRDEGASGEARKKAQDWLAQALGRPGTSYRFLPQRIHQPVTPGQPTGSGRLVGRTARSETGFSLSPRFDLLRGDLIRVGYEDEPWHRVLKVPKDTPKGGRLDFTHKGRKGPKPGTDVFLMDRREPELQRILGSLGEELTRTPAPKVGASSFLPQPPPPPGKMPPLKTLQLFRRLPHGKIPGTPALWLRPGILRETGRTVIPKIWWWLPPIIWPDEEQAWQKLVDAVRRAGGKTFVLGAPWQASLFRTPGPRHFLWAGPFCNLANAHALEEMKKLGIRGAFPSPELSGEDYLRLASVSPLPLGMVVSGLWPLCVARTLAKELKPNLPLASPMGELAFARLHGQNTWIFPGWPVNLEERRTELEQAGYRVFVHLHEPRPPQTVMERADSAFNWDLRLL